MKTIIIKSSTLLLFTLFLTFSSNVFAQRVVSWKGGTPGMENDWHCPANWSTATVPDEFSNVIIPDVSTSTFSSPVIKTGTIEVNSIYINPNATLTVGKDAIMVVYDEIKGNCEDNMHVEGIVVRHGENASFTMKMIALRIQ